MIVSINTQQVSTVLAHIFKDVKKHSDRGPWVWLIGKTAVPLMAT